MNINHDLSRRLFLRHAGTLSALLGGAAPVALNLSAIGSAAAQTAPDYKALVCLFFYGGNDAFNMFLPTDLATWNAYTTVRNQQPDPISLLAPGVLADVNAVAGSPARLGGVLPITPANAQGRTYALHPMMGTLQTMFNTDKRLAVLTNIGTLVKPTTKVQYSQASYPKPAYLFSHNDQQNTWQALGPEGVSVGWGGRMGDLLASANTRPVFTAISAAGNAVWVSGSQVQQYQVSTTGAIAMGIDTNGRIYGSNTVGSTLQRLMSSVRTTHPFDADAAAVARRAIDAETVLRTGLAAAGSVPFGTPPTGSASYNASTDKLLQYLNPLTGSLAANGLAQQFQVVARLIDAGMRGVSGAQRQVFFVSIGGFDTHDLQNRGHADLYARVSQAMTYFDSVMGSLNARNNVTTFTASDFGRTMTSNGDGTDHGWGSHHFVMGGAVKGGDIYGTVPTLGLKNVNNNNFDSSPDQIGNGILVPTISVDQLGATLGRWFGLSDAQLAGIFPNLANFNASVRNLGFMNA